MKLNLKHNKVAVAMAVAVVSAAAIAGTLIQLTDPVVVSTADPANNAFKAKMGWIAYKSDAAQAQYDVKAQLLVYADGPAGKQNIYVARSTDNGATWTRKGRHHLGGGASADHRHITEFSIYPQQAQYLRRRPHRRARPRRARAPTP